jgi:hypothetical protein
MSYGHAYYQTSVNSLHNAFPIAPVAEFFTTAQNPLRDIDLTVNTDCEDLLVFMCDIIEFVEQDKAFLSDALFDFCATTPTWGTTISATATSLEFFVLLKLRQQTQISLFLRKFNV